MRLDPLVRRIDWSVQTDARAKLVRPGVDIASDVSACIELMQLHRTERD